MGGPILTPLHAPYWHPENVTCWQDYAGVAGDLMTITLVIWITYALLLEERIKQWRQKRNQ